MTESNLAKRGLDVPGSLKHPTTTYSKFTLFFSLGRQQQQWWRARCVHPGLSNVHNTQQWAAALQGVRADFQQKQNENLEEKKIISKLRDKEREKHVG